MSNSYSIIIIINLHVQVMSAAIEVFSSKDANTQVNNVGSLLLSCVHFLD